ncbi:MAG: hypothetical protein GY744_07395 [Gammaproteobacteria bacterium]|nr:hypothetical protein [Gammaproteobacteria bacterium]
MKNIEQQKNNEAETDPGVEIDADESGSRKQRHYLLPVFLFLGVIAIMAAGSYQAWQLFTQSQQQTQVVIQQLQDELAKRPTLSRVDSGIKSIRQSVNKTDDRLSGLERGQQALADSTEKLYELYGRDENGWKLAEVEYLMLVAQHKLVLENDFEGSAKTLKAASDRIAELADPGLLPVRVQINEEIVQLKSRARPDLVGMTLLLSRLTRQISSLKPGYQTQAKKAETTAPDKVATDPNLPLQQKVMDFMTSLVTIKSSQPETKKSTAATVIIDVTEKLEDYLKLTRWSVLERDAFQYKKLMAQNVNLFKEYYDLTKAANADFYESLLALQKSQIKPELPDISGSLLLLKQVQQKRESETPQQNSQETDNG